MRTYWSVSVLAFVLAPVFGANPLLSGEIKLLPVGASAGAGFGSAMALSDDFLVGGAPTDAGNTTFAGAVYVYGVGGRSWRLTASDGTSTGAAYVYRQTETGGRIGEAKLLPPPTNPAQKLTGTYYGSAVTISGDRLAIGGPQADWDQQQDGAVLVVGLQNGMWVYQASLDAPDGGSNDQLGTAVDMDNGIVLAGAPGHDQLGADAGAAYLFTLGPPTDPNNKPPSPAFSATRDRLTVHCDWPPNPGAGC